ncbi:MAG: hypothetical protein IKG98_05585 [Ruminococcus sp.]|nr:hypothetical protein [Ruminococcus sp.]
METKAERSRAMRWKKPALADLSLWAIDDRLTDIRDECCDIRWAIQDDDMLINALDGNEEEAFEFKMLFTDLENEAEQLCSRLDELFQYDDDREARFDDCTVALLGDRFKVVGYDTVEEDYFSLTSYCQELAVTEAGKRIMRLTKKELLSEIGQCLGIVLSFHNVEIKYEYLKATFDILRDQNVSIIQTIRDINEAYERANEVKFREWEPKTIEFDRLIALLSEQTDKLWLE